MDEVLGFLRENTRFVEIVIQGMRLQENIQFRTDRANCMEKTLQVLERTNQTLPINEFSNTEKTIRIKNR